MKTSVNNAMLDLLGGDPEFHEPSSIAMPDRLGAFATSGFTEIEGCVVSKLGAQQSRWPQTRMRGDHVDETGFECTHNHIHVDTFFESEIELPELARTGNDLAFWIGRQLVQSGIVGPFRIIVSAQPSDADLGVGPTCVVRFHRLRAGQAWLDEYLEHYGSEAVAVLDFD